MNSETWIHEDGIVSNSKLVCYGEFILSFAHTAHHARRIVIVGKYNKLLIKLVLLYNTSVIG